MTHSGPSNAIERIEELAALVALDTASAAEREEFAGWLQSEQFADEARRALASFEATAACLGESVEPLAPPPGGLEKLLAMAGPRAHPSRLGAQELLTESRDGAVGQPSVHDSTVNITNTTRDATAASHTSNHQPADVFSLSAFRAKRVPLSVVAVAIVAAAAFLFLYIRERSHRRLDAAAAAAASEAIQQDAQAEIETLTNKLAQMRERSQLLATRFEPLRAPKLRLATLSNDSSYAHVLVDDANHWLVVADGLPAISGSKDYQLWFVPPTGKPVSAGLLRPDVDGVMAMTFSVPASLRGTRLRPAISLEPKGGSAQPTEVKLIGEPI